MLFTLIALVTLLTAAAHAQAPDTLWTRLYPNGEMWPGTRAITNTIDGGFAMSGQVADSQDAPRHGLIIKTDGEGNQEWYNSYRDNAPTIFEDIVSFPNGDLAGIGSGYVVRVNLEGDTVWTVRYNDISAQSRMGIIAENGDLILVGRGQEPESWDISTVLIRIDGGGNYLWAQFYRQPGFPVPVYQYAIAHAPDSGFLLVSKLAYEFGDDEQGLRFIRTNADGDTLWTNQLLLEGERLDVRTMVVHDDWEYSIAGVVSLDDGFHREVFVARLDANADTLWTRLFPYAIDGPNRMELIEAEDGGVVVSGTIGGFSASALVFRVSRYGVLVWERIIADEAGIDEYIAEGIVATSDGGYAMGGGFLDWEGSDLEQAPVLYRFEPDTVTASSTPASAVPSEFELLSVYPNPFNFSTTIRYSLAATASVELQLYDLLGRQVHTLLNQRQVPGSYEVPIDGQALPSGIYFANLTTSQQNQTIKLILQK